jgi:hypothetical protein
MSIETRERKGISPLSAADAQLVTGGFGPWGAAIGTAIGAANGYRSGGWSGAAHGALFGAAVGFTGGLAGVTRGFVRLGWTARSFGFGVAGGATGSNRHVVLRQ